MASNRKILGGIEIWFHIFEVKAPGALIPWNLFCNKSGSFVPTSSAIRVAASYCQITYFFIIKGCPGSKGSSAGIGDLVESQEVYPNLASLSLILQIPVLPFFYLHLAFKFSWYLRCVSEANFTDNCMCIFCFLSTLLHKPSNWYQSLVMC